MKRMIPMAICYDFDGTLAPGNMQEYGFVKKLHMAPSDFWETANGLARDQKGDEILTYMKVMLDESYRRGLSVRREDFQSYGKDIKFFEGVEDYFARINRYAKAKGVKLKHYIISSGLREILEGTSIAHEFAEMFASSFLYDKNGNAVWPAMALNFTSKTQYIYRINKGCLDVTDIEGVNRHVAKECKPVPLTNILYIGDGNTDIPCMAMLNKAGGHTMAVYKDGQKERAASLNRDGRAHMVAPADYREGKKIDLFVKAVIDKIAADGRLKQITRP